MGKQDGSWHLTDIINGAFVGLGSITAGSGFVPLWAAPVISTTAGFASWYLCMFFKQTLGLDDVLDVAAIQGVPGIIGTILVGVFADPALQRPADMVGYDTWVSGANGIIFADNINDGFSFLLVQVAGVAISIFWTAFWTWVTMTLIKYTVGLDVSPEVEEIGLDLVQIGLQAYDDKLNMTLDLSHESLVSMMCEAAAKGDLVSIHQFVTSGVDPCVMDYDGRTALHLAAAEGHKLVLKYLTSLPTTAINVQDRYGNTALMDAICHGQVDCINFLKKQKGIVIPKAHCLEDIFLDKASRGQVRDMAGMLAIVPALVEKVNYDGCSALHLATSENHTDIVALLLRNGADPEQHDRWGRRAYDLACTCGHEACIELLEGATRIHVAKNRRGLSSLTTKRAHKDDSPCSVITNVTTRSDFNEPLLQVDLSNDLVLRSYDLCPEAAKQSEAAGKTATREICFAASKGHLDEVKRLLKKRADHNAKDYDSRTALHLATCGNHLPVVEFLYSQKADLDVKDRWGHTPLEDAISHDQTNIADWLRMHDATQSSHLTAHRLCCAAANGNLSVLENLHNEGTDLNLANTDGRTALHLAASEGHVSVVEWLIKQNVNTSPVDRNGSTPYMNALHARHKEVAALLESKTVYTRPPDHRVEL